ncbi:MAG: arsenite efflux transporter metallochaperone ArsD [Gammaproteobacteria bacterium]|nr:arsenite efflux transporter metallochaperone ArsD [Gammaproteobacteria bacterium]
MNVTLEVFDPAMCCSTGVCGPSVDPKLARFAADLDWLKGQGVEIRRYNLGQEPGAFAEREAVRRALDGGEAALPLIFVNGKEVSHAVYPARETLAHWTGVGNAKNTQVLYTPAVEQLVALGAAIAANCESCFKHHYDQARKLGVSNDDMLAAVRTAQKVKESPANNMLALAERFLGAPVNADATPRVSAADNPKGGGCCGPNADSALVKSGASKCC